MARRRRGKSAKRRPLVQRAALHALKVLVKKHPRAALAAAGAGAGYAASSVATDASAAVRDAAEQTRETMTGLLVRPERRELSPDECEDILAAMTPRQRKAFAALARRG